jgi:epoxyqueuosine reductase
VGFASAREEPPGSRRLLEWLLRGHHGGMGWMARDPEARIDPQRILPGARTAIAVALAYRHPDPVPLAPGAPLVSRYAWGDDYHVVMGEKLRALEAALREECPAARTRIACDTSPVMDKAWAVAAGIGWEGKNACVIHPANGSWLFLGEIFTDVEIAPDPPAVDRCGTCTACLEACPTGAFPEPYVLDARRCISYLTIERRGPFEPAEAGAIGDWLVGCDVCQDVCPWNRRAPDSVEGRFRPRPGLAGIPALAWVAMPEEEIRARIRGTAVTRIKPADLQRNARAVVENRSRPAGG